VPFTGKPKLERCCFRDNRPDGYPLHAVYWAGLLPSRALTAPNPFIRQYFP